MVLLFFMNHCFLNEIQAIFTKLKIGIFFRLFGTKCDKCLRSFGKNDFVMRAKNKIFHLECFRCVACEKQLGMVSNKISIIMMIFGHQMHAKQKFHQKFDGFQPPILVHIWNQLKSIFYKKGAKKDRCANFQKNCNAVSWQVFWKFVQRSFLAPFLLKSDFRNKLTEEIKVRLS